MRVPGGARGADAWVNPEAAAGYRELIMPSPALTSPIAPGERSADDARWAALCARSRPSDDPFIYAVKTTGVYCRPGCASRLPKRDNVSFHADAAAAKAAGYRPCLRC